ncbi:hypothetical protein [Streptomyces sp. ST2-7A]|uniref:hypothetical protein n=1 Tax=Streptomyces sp. ST2-7A TaxID=2907214 RepID=UPI001F3E56AA|nr:hypothetical protein [Streptomyces sp. ST2-7A]MCE7083226.1 hypothetical protein [Streptomyces sp. ST2-7A]
MAATTAAMLRRRTRHTSATGGTGGTARRNAAVALQRALDRRDNGGVGEPVVPEYPADH